MQVEELGLGSGLEGVVLFRPKVFQDTRGFFVERFQRERFRAVGLPIDYFQDNFSRSHAGVLRGLHYQTQPWQSKLVSVISGKILDVVVDLRPDSKTCGKSISVELTGDGCEMLWVPKGFAHGFCVLGDQPVDLFYKVDGPWDPKSESGVRWDDPDLKIQWPLTSPDVSPKDRVLPSLQETLRKVHDQW
jgi:dTDP-4-dehydrorhamnose 3,5-epimerase